MLMTSRIPGFSAKTCAFHFDNRFPAGTSYPVINLPVVGTITNDASKGICDGFSFAVLDLYLHCPRLTPSSDTTAPGASSNLFKYIAQRENDAWFANGLSNFWKGFQWIHTPDHDTGFDILSEHIVTQRGLAWKTIKEEWPLIKEDIDSGRPSPLWLVTPPSCPETNIPQTILALTNHHQVLAFGYTIDDAQTLTINIYDPQIHDSDTNTITLNIAVPEHTTSISVPSVGAKVRGFFRSYYEFHDASSIVPHLAIPVARKVALRTVNGNTLTIVNGGGLPNPIAGMPFVALHTAATQPGLMETFVPEWVDSTHVALKTSDGHYVTAVKGGGVGGPNSALCPVHTDATWMGPWEMLRWNYNPKNETVCIQTPDGHYLSAIDGGGIGGADTMPIHTDATARGPWEVFEIIYLS